MELKVGINSESEIDFYSKSDGNVKKSKVGTKPERGLP